MPETTRAQILEVLAEASEPVDIQAVAEATGTPIKSLYEALSRPNRGELIEATDKGFWQIREALERILSRITTQEARSKEQGARRKKQGEPSEKDSETTPEAVPSQSDLFRPIGERLAFHPSLSLLSSPGPVLLPFPPPKFQQILNQVILALPLILD